MLTLRVTPLRRTAVLVAVAVGLFASAARLRADPTPGPNDPIVAQIVCAFLKQGHLNKPEIGDEISRRLFKQFLKDLDPTKLYFVKSDIDEFKASETDLDDQLLKGDFTFAYKVYERLVKRVAERQALVKELVAAPHDFTAKESMDVDYDKMGYAADDAELRERWRKRIKFDLLVHKLDKKPLPEAEAKQKVLDRYQGLLKTLKQFDNYDLMELYLTALTTSADPHSTYMSPATLDDFEIAMRLNLEGIGALLRSENGQTLITEIIPGGAAAADGRLQPDDHITAVAQGDGKFTDVADMKLRAVVKLIRGTPATTVQLKVRHAGKLEPVVIELTRRKIELNSQAARADVVEQGKKADGKPYRIGVIDLPSFYVDTGDNLAGKAGMGKSATEDVRKLLKDLTAQNVDGIVLDLRRNGGGSLNQALALTGLFIDQGPIVQVKGSNGAARVQVDPEAGTVYAGPLTVLVSRFSASASEILAGALQDYGRALIVGDESTHGKGTVQAMVDLGGQMRQNPPPKLGALKLTIQQFYRVNGDSTQNRGVSSDVVIPSLTEYVATTEQNMPNALAFDKVAAVKHDDLHEITSELKADLKGRSAERVKKSAEFAKLAKDIQSFKERKERKIMPLNEAELREQFTRDEAEKAGQRSPDADPPKPDANYKFKRSFYNDEVLDIMVDYLQAKKAK